jgi:coenzyme F420-reducing hydrogenase alpha subunit
VLSRFTARLREMAALIAGSGTQRAGAVSLGGGRGIGWTENARGLLVHLATVAEGRAARYRILAPTEWNFHPDGALSRGLCGTRYASEADLRHRAALLVQSLDPCVAWRLDLDHA